MRDTSNSRMTEPLSLNTQLLFAQNGEPLPCTAQKFYGAQIAQNSDLLYAITSLYMHVLPNISLEDMQRDILSDDSYSLYVFRSDESVIRDFQQNPSRILRRFYHKQASCSDYSDDEAENCPDDLLKAEEFIYTKKKCQFEKYVRQKFPLLYEVYRYKGALSYIRPDSAKIRAKDRLIGALTVGHKEIMDSVQGKIKVAQLLYIGVRTRFQLLKLGRRLLYTAIIDAYSGNRTCFFTFAGSDAVRFFRNAGLSDDPMLAGFFQQLDENWTDVVPMVRYLNAGENVENIGEEMTGNYIFNKWRSQAYAMYKNESNLVGQMVLEIYRLKSYVTELRREQETHEQAITLEKSRGVMYEYLVQYLENQLLSAGIKPNVDQEYIMSKVLGKFGIE